MYLHIVIWIVIANLANVVATRGGDWLKHNLLTTNTPEHILYRCQESGLEWRNVCNFLHSTHTHMCVHIPGKFQSRKLLVSVTSTSILWYCTQYIHKHNTVVSFFVVKIFSWLLDLTKIKSHKKFLPQVPMSPGSINAISITHGRDVVIAIFI